MRIVVLVKQVPADGTVRMEEGRLMRDAVPGVLNPMCEYALDLAVRLGGEVVALSMGPPQAVASLERCLELGAGRAILLSGREFAGADALATSTALASAIQWIGDVDLILTGQQAIDGDTGQVPFEVATMLDVPSVSHCSGASVSGDMVTLVTESDGVRSVVEARAPLLMAVSWGSNVRRMPSMSDLLRARAIGVEVVDADGIGIDRTVCGSEGSMTRVVRTFSPTSGPPSERIVDMERAIGAISAEIWGEGG